MKKNCMSSQYDKIKEDLQGRSREELLKQRSIAKVELQRDDSEKELFEIFNKAFLYITIFVSILAFAPDKLSSPINVVAQVVIGALILTYSCLAVYCFGRLQKAKKHFKQSQTAQLKLDIIEDFLKVKEPTN